MFKRTALICIASASLMLLASAAHALTTKPFTEADFAAAQASGKPVAILAEGDGAGAIAVRAEDFVAPGIDPGQGHEALFIRLTADGGASTG